MEQVRKHPWVTMDTQVGANPIYSDQELEQIRKDFAYRDLIKKTKVEHTLPMFTEHELDEECGGKQINDTQLKNCSSKSLVLAPFNSTWSDKDRQVSFDVVDKRVIKYANRVKDVNRQYELNNNADLDNGVYNKFINQSSSSSSDGDEDDDEKLSPSDLLPKD